MGLCTAGGGGGAAWKGVPGAPRWGCAVGPWGGGAVAWPPHVAFGGVRTRHIRS